jgi:flagellar basal-body rod protein FlgF/flagellar basal-body rod protein FlgG
MGSGKYGALSGAVAREQAMTNIANNLANINSNGFKKNRISFAAILRGAQQVTADSRGINLTRIRKIGTDFSQGGMQDTGRPLDVAIDGEGFFKVRRGNEVFFTRGGHLMIDENGMVKTADGLNLIDAGEEPLQLETAAGQNVSIGENGEIAINGEPGGGQIQVFAVNDPDKLVKVGGSLYRLDEGGTSQPAEAFRVVQGSLETANVNMVEEMTSMIATQRSFEAHHKVLESYSKLGEKQDELGTVG